MSTPTTAGDTDRGADRSGCHAFADEGGRVQVVDDYLKLNGYFTTHNIGFPPSLARPDIAPASSILSDVDVVATTRASS